MTPILRPQPSHARLPTGLAPMRWLVRAAVFGVLWLVPSFAFGQNGLQFSHALRMPSSGDRLGDSRAIFADLHAGELFVCDTRKNRIVIFDHEGLFRHEIPGGEAFRAPIDVVVDPDGYIFVLAYTDSGKTILLLDFDGRPIEVIRLSGLQPDQVRAEPKSIALSPSGDQLFVVDGESKSLLICDRQGSIRQIVDLSVGLADDKAREEVFGHVDVFGDRVLVAAATRGLILVFDLDGNRLGSVGIKGATPCHTAFPVAASLQSERIMLILDQQRMVFMRWDLQVNRCLDEFSGFGDAPGFLYRPSDLTIDATGQVVVSQGFEGRVQVFRKGPEPRHR